MYTFNYAFPYIYFGTPMLDEFAFLGEHQFTTEENLFSI